MNEFINVLNNNQGAVMCLLTLVYVVATILICIFNYKSASATKMQSEEMKKQFYESNRARIIPKIMFLEGEIYCLVFENIGKNIATEVIIDISEDWLKQFKDVSKFSTNEEKLGKLKNTSMYMDIGQQLFYPICIIGDGTRDHDKITKIDFEVKISYRNYDKIIEENFKLPLSNYNHLVNTSDYVRLTKKTNSILKEISNKIKK